MSAATKVVTATDILTPDDYTQRRQVLRREGRDLKKARRLSVGPFAEFHFECYQTMWLQIQEMLHIEKGGAEQLVEELGAYNPLIPQGQELVATLMLEIVDEEERRKTLVELGGIENLTYIEVAGHVIHGIPDDDMVRTDESGKTSSVHFIHFPFPAEAIDAFKAPDAEVIVGIRHENYRHMAGLPEALRNALRVDFD